MNDIKTVIKKMKKLGLKLGFMKFIGYEAVFSCAFRQRGSDGAYTFLPNSDDYWYADPLICSRGGRQIVFMERVDRHTGRGCIACADITDGTWGDIVPVIEESFHMSFPMCFEWNGELFMIPETEMDECINLYRCMEFPYKWERSDSFMQGLRIVDTVVQSRSDDRITFLGSEYKPGDDFYTRFYRFSLECSGDGSIVCEELGLISEEYSLHSRMAGYPIEENGRVVFPVQRSTSGVYGYSVMFMIDDAHSGEMVREILPEEISLDRKKKLIGVHTYSRSDDYEVIDVQYLVKKVKSGS